MKIILLSLVLALPQTITIQTPVLLITGKDGKAILRCQTYESGKYRGCALVNKATLDDVVTVLAGGMNTINQSGGTNSVVVGDGNVVR